MGLKPSASCFETLFCDCIVNTCLARKVYNNDEKTFFSVYQRLQSPRVIMSINTRLRRASIQLKPARDIDWCPFRLHMCSRYNHRTLRNHSPRASTSINTRLRRTSFPLKPAPDTVWCPFPLRHTRNQHGLSSITTHLVSIVNAYKVYNNMCCSPHCFADRAATHYHTRAGQTLIHGKVCFILLLTSSPISS